MQCTPEWIIYYSSSSLSMSRSGLGELAQLVPLHSPHAGEQLSPFFLHVHRLSSQSVVQPHRITLSSDDGAAGWSVCMGSYIPLSRFHPQSLGTRPSASPFHS